jgi:hypothetical protein
MLLVLAAASGGCRGIIGYEDLVLDTDASVPIGASDAAGPGAIDSGTHAPSDASAAADTATGVDAAKPPIDECTGLAVPDCFPCCRTHYGPEFAQLKQLAQNQCYCNGHGCETECGSWCGDPSTPPPAGPCGKCLDDKLRSCQTVLSTCNGQANCAPAAGCVERCQ